MPGPALCIFSGACSSRGRAPQHPVMSRDRSLRPASLIPESLPSIGAWFPGAAARVSATDKNIAMKALGSHRVRAFGSRLALWFIALGLASGATAQEPSIQYVEPIAIALKSGAAQFDAYGRHFALTLVDNERVLSKLSAQRKLQLQNVRMLRGSLDGAPGSWVRLTSFAGGVEGAIWDGHDLYTVTSYERIAPYLTAPIDATPGQTVVYRLSDSRDILPRDFCDLADGTQMSKATNGLEQYQAVVRGLEGGVITPQLTRQIEISLIADSAFQAAEPGDPTAAMLARLNIVEGIFSEQLGLLVLATDVRLMPANADPFTATKGSSLLEQVGAYRAATPEVRARGLAHLMTGKDLDGTTAGIAYVRTVCDVENGVSISSRSYGTTVSALIMAHELGHNFGAEHDGVPGTSCASVGGGFIMASSVSGYSTFSQCSIDTIEPVLASASCVTPAEYADVTVNGDGGSVSGEGGLPFTLPFVVQSTGNVAAEDAVLTVTLPENVAFSIDSAASTLGSCSVSGFTATCMLGSMPVDATAQVSVIARSTSAGNFSVQARVTAANDRLTSNNNRQLAVAIRSGVDASVALSASASDVTLGTPIEIYADVTSERSMAVRNAVLSVNLNQAVTSASMPGGVCTTSASSVSCTIAEISAGTTRRLTVHASTQVAGSLFAGANITALGDGDFSNNNANTTAWVQAERDVEITAGAVDALLSVGAVYEVPYTLRSRGPAPTGDVTLTISLPSSALAVDSIDAGGASCTSTDSMIWRCTLGTLAPGSSRVVRLRVHGTGPVTGDLIAIAVASNDGYAANNNTVVHLRIDHLVDVAVTMASGGAGLEDEVFEGQVSLRSNGRQTTSGATLDINLHSAGVLRFVAINNGATCPILSAQRARCTLPAMARSSQLYVNYSAEFSEPGNYDVTFTAAAQGDTAPDNDTLNRVVLVRPFNDIGVSGSLEMADLFGGQVREKIFNVTTDRRALASARIVASHVLPGLSVQAISATAGQSSVGDCRVDAVAGGICDFTDLPAFATVTVKVTYLAAQGSWALDPRVSASTAGDVVSSNNAVTAHVETHATTDLELHVADSLVGSRAATLGFPLISVVNGAEVAFGTRLEVTLPSQVSLVSVSAANATCSGTIVLRCDFRELAPGATATVALTVRASAEGSFVSALRLTASNDNNPANDSQDVTVQISGSNATAVSATNSDGGGGGKGGGGRLEFWMLGLLALIAARRYTLRKIPVTQ
jgi:hypothetical protein